MSQYGVRSLSDTGLLPAAARLSSRVLLDSAFLNSATDLVLRHMRSHNPHSATPPGCSTERVWADPVSLAATQGVAFAFFSSGYSDVSIPPVPSCRLCIHQHVTPHDGCRVSPFGHPRINARSTTPRGFSQPPTSFIGNRRQGIHRWPFKA